MVFCTHSHAHWLVFSIPSREPWFGGITDTGRSCRVFVAATVGPADVEKPRLGSTSSGICNVPENNIQERRVIIIIIIIIMNNVLINVTLSCQRHCRGTIHKIRQKKTNKTTEALTISSRVQTTVILCSTITIAYCQTTTEKVQSSARDGTLSATVHSWQTTAGFSTHVPKPLGRHGHRVLNV